MCHDKGIEADSLLHDIVNCTMCELYETRNTAIPGRGNTSANIMLIADKPDVTDENEGWAFTGHTLPYLENTMTALGIEEDDVWVTNCVKCRPPKNREPFIPELDICKAHLQREIRMVDPNVIIMLGKIPIKTLTGVTQAVVKAVDKEWILYVPTARGGEDPPLQYFALSTYDFTYIRKNPSQKPGQPWHRLFKTFKHALWVTIALEETYERTE